jgi:flavin reductase
VSQNRAGHAQRAFRDVLGIYRTGVAVLTVGGPPHEVTVNSVTSMSLDPPLVAVCVRLGTRTDRLLGTSEDFGLSVLAMDQAPLAKYFADSERPTGPGQFDRVGARPGKVTTTVPLDGASAWLECTVDVRYVAGNHVIVLSAVLSVHAGGREPLLFHPGRFRTTGLTEDGPAVAILE